MKKRVLIILVLSLIVCFAAGGQAYADKTTVNWSEYSLEELKEIENEIHETILTLQRQYADEYGDRVLTIEQGEKQIYAGSTLTLTTGIEKVLDSAPDQTKLVWTSSDETVATVNAAGTVKGIASGIAEITCMAEDNNVITAKTEIQVLQPVTGVVLEKAAATILMIEGNEDNGIQLKANVQPEDAFIKELVWTSSNEAVATVDGSGYVSASAPGTAIITVSSTDPYSANMPKSAKCTITVKQAAASIELDNQKMALNLGATQTLKATVFPDNTTDKSVKWTSSDDTVVAVTNGVVRATGTGEATVTCTAGDGSGVIAECHISVIQMVTGIKIVDVTRPIVLYKNDEYPLKAEITPDYATDQTVTWSSSNESVATVSEDGKLFAVSGGNATITCLAMDGSGKSATCEVLVAKPVRSISLDKKSMDLYLGERQKLTAKILPEDAYNRNVVWTSGNERVLTVDQSGNLTPVGPGTADVVCTAQDGSGVLGTCTVNVLVGTTKVTLSERTLNLLLGSDEELAFGQISYTVEPENATYKNVTWSSSNEKIATVDKDGIIKAIDVGTATVTAKTADPKNADRVLATATVTVGSAVTGLEISGLENGQLATGGYVRLVPVIKPENATNKKVTWASSNEKILTVDAAGNVRAVGKGTATITCTAADDSGTEASVEITVYQPVTGISPRQSMYTLFKGDTRTVFVDVSPSNATNTDLDWSTDSSCVTIVSAKGKHAKFEGKYAGIATITATAKDGSGKSCVFKIAVEPTNPLEVVGTQRGRYQNNLLTIQFKNNCKNSTITNVFFDMYMYSGWHLIPVNGGSYSAVNEFRLGPGATYSLSGDFSGIAYAQIFDITITKVQFADGSIFTIPENERKTTSWQFD